MDQKKNQDQPNRGNQTNTGQGQRGDQQNWNQGQNPQRDQAEGSREQVRGEDTERGQGNQGGRNRASEGSGITNRGAQRERKEQEELPSRGRSRSDSDRSRNADVEKRPRDVGRTSGGGSLGHVQPKDVTEQGPIRNQAEERPSERRDAFDQDDDPVMPADDSTLRTKI